MSRRKARQAVRALDRGQVWVRWTPEVHDDNPTLAEAVEAFEAVGTTEAARAATRWLKESALANYRSTVTWLMSNEPNDFVDAYYSVASSQVELRQSARKKLGAEHPIQPATLVTWIAKAEGSPVSGMQVLAHAAATARRVSRLQGVIALVLDPYDEATAELWRAPPYNFKSSKTRAPDGRPRLWRQLL